MALAGVGVDILEIARMERAMERTPAFTRRMFTDEERAYCERRARPAQHYAGRFAAREAVLKALGCGFSGGVGMRDVSVVLDEAGRPQAVLTGKVAEIAQKQGVLEVAISMSFTHDVAVANAVAVTDAVRPKQPEVFDPRRELDASFKEARKLIDELERVSEEEFVQSRIPGLDLDLQPAEAPDTDAQPEEAADEQTTQPEESLPADEDDTEE